MGKLHEIKGDIAKFADPKKAKVLQGFFKTGKGEYGEGDVFLGLTGPLQRTIAKRYGSLSLSDVNSLLHSRIHEHRQIALLILVGQFRIGTARERKSIYGFYLKNARRVNNWDLVDCSAPNIVGEYLFDKNKDVLLRLANSEDLWERRIAVVSTLAFIRKGRFDETLMVSGLLLSDSHDLIHKACGWMLREVGKRDQAVLELFLKQHSKKMPRTMLRYSIERLDEKKRKSYMRR